MDNPYRSARLELGLTQQELATTSNVSSQVVTNLERGLFYKPPSNVVRAISQEYQERYIHWNHDRAAQTYTQWVREQRASHGDRFPTVSTIQAHRPEAIALDWVDFRHLVHKTFRGFCRALVFQPSMLAEWEDRGLNRSAVTKALREVGYSEVAADIIVSMRKSSVEI